MKDKNWLRNYVIALAAIAAAVVIRWAVTPVMGDFLPLATLYGAVAVVVWVAGYRTAIVAALVGYVAIDWFLVPPFGEFTFFHPRHLIGFALYSLSCGLIIGIGEALRRARRNAQIASEQVSIVADSMSVGVTRCSRDMRYLWVNESYCRWIRMPADELLGRPIKDVVGADAFEQLLPLFERVLNGETVRYEKEVRFHNQEPSWIHATYTPTHDREGTVDGWVAVVLEISERKQAEAERYALSDQVRTSRERIQADLDALTRLHQVTLLCGAPDATTEECLSAILETAIAFTRADRGNIQLLHANDSTLELVVHQGFEQPFLSFFKSVRSGDVSACAAAMQHRQRVVIEDVLSSEVLAGSEEHRVLLAAGVRAVQSTPMLTSHGKLVGIISTHFAQPRKLDERDTRWMDLLAQQGADYLQRIEASLALKESEERYRSLVDDLTRATEALREADRKKDEFLAMLSHELRNPLAPIGYAAEILKKQDPSPEQLAKAREVIGRQVRQMARLLDDLMDVSRITRGAISLRREPVELALVVNEAVEASLPFIEQCGHTLHVDVPSASLVLDADTTRLSQVLMNLLNNAAKYTERGGTIELCARREGDSAVITVKDTGVGITPEMLGRIFELFTQEERLMERARGGLGIGLSLAQRLVSLHGGTLKARSEGAGRGSEFVIRLPVVAENHVRAVGSKPEKTNGAHQTRILVVDDNEDSADTMAMFLTSEGHEVVTAHDGLEAVETSATFQPAVVLLDIGLPRLNGYDAATRIRAQRGSDVVLIALTGWGQEADRRRSREAGFDHHLTKPVELDELRLLLSSVQIPASRP